MGTRERVTFDILPPVARAAVEAEIGTIRHVEPVGSGLNSTFAAVLHTDDTVVFVKATPDDHPRIRGHQREAAIAPHTTGIAPRLRWQLDAGGWNLLGFDHLPGRAADLAPGSPDLVALASSLTRLGELVRPELPLHRIEQRWAGLAGDSDLALLAGDHLLHTDLNPNNILISGGRAWLVDWAWPTLGAGWIDAACAALWLIAEGHTPSAAEAWAHELPVRRPATQAGLDTFVAVNVRLWARIADDDPQPWKLALRDAATQWQTYRRSADAGW
jgi:hypothetical protein